MCYSGCSRICLEQLYKSWIVKNWNAESGITCQKNAKELLQLNLSLTRTHLQASTVEAVKSSLSSSEQNSVGE